VAFNPLRREADMFRLLIYIAAVMAVIILVIVLVRS